MHGKLDFAKSKGLKKSEIGLLQRLLQQRIPANKILTRQLAETAAEITQSTGYPLSMVVNRRGQVVNLTVGKPSQINMPELKGLRFGPGRLSGHRVIHTQFNPKDETLNKDNLQCLAQNRLDLLAMVQVDPKGNFSRSRGEKVTLADSVQIAYLLPARDSDGQLWKIRPPCTARKAEEEDFSQLIYTLEDDFRKKAPSLATTTGEERAILVGLIQEGTDAWEIEDDLDELSQLSRTAGAQVCGRLVQSRSKSDPRFFLGAGKVQELALLVQELGATLVVIDDELSPNQQRNMEAIVNVKVIDRTELILDIFSQRAQSKEGKLQVELAQLKYLVPRLIGKGVGLSKLGGGIGTRGPGETKLEIDRRRIRERINFLENETLRIRSHRDTQRRNRTFQNLPVVSLTGYTNSGKSTLLNALTKSAVFVEDKLFATLDPATRRTTLPDHSPVLLTDTVGFIKKLPTSLIAAFGATLEEVVLADVLLHVVDASHPNALDQVTAVFEVLSDLGAVDKPMITVLNKAELVRKEDLQWLAAQVPNPVAVSASKRVGMGRLLAEIEKLLQDVCPNRTRYTA